MGVVRHCETCGYVDETWAYSPCVCGCGRQFEAHEAPEYRDGETPVLGFLGREPEQSKRRVWTWLFGR